MALRCSFCVAAALLMTTSRASKEAAGSRHSLAVPVRDGELSTKVDAQEELHLVLWRGEKAFLRGHGVFPSSVLAAVPRNCPGVLQRGLAIGSSTNSHL
jgi:hypothetical protein